MVRPRCKFINVVFNHLSSKNDSIFIVFCCYVYVYYMQVIKFDYENWLQVIMNSYANACDTIIMYSYANACDTIIMYSYANSNHAA